ncbi:hypothetical protein MED121_07245 [Marinomonas sp. MED121]|uniref:phage tail protein n=1 Tax=Marinomonas sp. MED121 TaxID=314277 RepID=UPI0000690455|nr:phage tail protein [Marinomonas sp. MED121]EAQ66460.1 hypothetical protein MED121_07245 [Marinomonas sp. MED121]
MVAKFELPVWIREGKEVTKLADAFGSFWDKTEAWIKTPLNQLDAETCHVYVLKLLAYQNDIDRFANEPDELFRKRVKHGVKNAIDAGSKGGFKEVLARFDVPLYGQIERASETDWDVITLWLADSSMTQNPELAHHIIRQYGRTCRRYEFLMLDRLDDVSIEGLSFGLDKSIEQLNLAADYVFMDKAGAAQVSLAQHFIERSEDRITVI